MKFENKRNLITILSLLLILSAITLFLLKIDMKLGVYYIRDVYGYLNNALFFAGYESGVSNLRGLSPFIPLLTSLLFRAGFISDSSILITSSIFYILSGIGIYYLFRVRFNELLSFTGAIILSTFAINIVWVSKGMLDIPGLCLSIWSIYFTVLSFKKNPKFLYLAFPTVIIGFFTKYTVILIIPVLIIQFLLLKEPCKFVKKNLKIISISCILGLITLLLFLGIYRYYNLPFFFISQTQTISSAQIGETANITHNNLFYYINNILIYMSSGKYIPYSVKPGFFSITELQWKGGSPTIISYIYSVLLILGLILYLMKLFSKENRLILKSQTSKIDKLLIITSTISLIIFLLTFTKISIIISEILITVSLLCIFKYLNKLNLQYFDLDFIFFYWFIVNFIFFTYHQTKVDRYAITFTPFFAYALITSLTLIYNKINNKKYSSKLKNSVPVILVCLILIISGFYCLTNEPHTFDNQFPPNLVNSSNNEKAIGNWLANYDSSYQSKNIWADRGGDMSFILKMEIPSVDHISNNQNFTEELLANNVTYFISKDNKTINEPYIKLIQIGEVSIYANE